MMSNTRLPVKAFPGTSLNRIDPSLSDRFAL